MTVYVDHAATTPVDARVADRILQLMVEEFGNAGSRTHELGSAAKRAVTLARAQVAAIVDADPEDVIFTSGATESNNLALLGLAGGYEGGHLITSAIEHKAVLEPLEQLARRGFDVELVPVGSSGRVDAEDLLSRVRPDTIAVSLMHVNNETGIEQPIEAVAAGLDPDGPFLHVDAAQGFAKVRGALNNRRIDMLSLSGHKLFGPKGVGALILRRRNYDLPPLIPLMYGGGQERGLRPGTTPVPLVAGLALAADLAHREHDVRRSRCLAIREELLTAVRETRGVIHGDATFGVPHIVNFSLPGLDGEAALLLWKEHLAVSNGSACTSSAYEPSHVLSAMGLPASQLQGAIRLSWSHETPDQDWQALLGVLASAAW